MPFLLHGPFVGRHCLLFNQVTGTVRVQLFGILSMLIVLFHRYILLTLSFEFGSVFYVALQGAACFM